MHYVYILWSDKIKKRYTGYSENVTDRLNNHNSRKSTYTSRGIPWKLIYTEEYSTRRDALQREKYLKTGAGRDWLDKNISSKVTPNKLKK